MPTMLISDKQHDLESQESPRIGSVTPKKFYNSRNTTGNLTMLLGAFVFFLLLGMGFQFFGRHIISTSSRRLQARGPNTTITTTTTTTTTQVDAVVEKETSQLDKLMDLRDNTFLVEQKMTNGEAMEAFSGIEMSNVFLIKERAKALPFLVVREESECCERQFCKGAYGFKLSVYPVGIGAENQDIEARPLLTIEREFGCTDTMCCIPCFTCCGAGQKVTVRDGSGKVIGHTEEGQFSSCWTTKWGIYREDKGKEPIATSTTPIGAKCAETFCQDVDFEVKRSNGTPMAEIKRQYRCKCEDMMADLDHLQVTLKDTEADLNDRLMLLATSLLYKYNLFEDNKDNSQHHYF